MANKKSELTPDPARWMSPVEYSKLIGLTTPRSIMERIARNTIAHEWQTLLDGKRLPFIDLKAAPPGKTPGKGPKPKREPHETFKTHRN